MTDRQRFKTKPVIPDHNLFYRRVKFLCIHSSFAGEQNIAHIINIALMYPITDPEQSVLSQKWL